jgi:hypothetical protein
VTRADTIKDCMISTTIEYSQGNMYAVGATTYAGPLSVDTSVSRSLLSVYHLDDDTSKTTNTSLIVSGNAEFKPTTVEVPVKSRIFSRCGSKSAVLNLNQRMALNALMASPQRVIYDPDEFVFWVQVRLEWITCPY